MRNNLTSQPKNFMLKELREKASINQEYLAAMLNISSSTLRRWERDGIAPALTIKEWLILCDVLNLRFTELPYYFTGEYTGAKKA